MKLITLYRIARFLYLKKIPLIPKIIFYLQYILYNSIVPYKCSIGKNTEFAYGGIGVVIHSRAIIGNDCIIGQGITIGGKSKKPDVPRIGNKVYMAAGSRIIGDIEIGDNVIIGANSVVIKSVESNVVVAGVPAKVIKRNIKYENYV